MFSLTDSDKEEKKIKRDGLTLVSNSQTMQKCCKHFVIIYFGNKDTNGS